MKRFRIIIASFMYHAFCLFFAFSAFAAQAAHPSHLSSNRDNVHSKQSETGHSYRANKVSKDDRNQNSIASSNSSEQNGRILAHKGNSNSSRSQPKRKRLKVRRGTLHVMSDDFSSGHDLPSSFEANIFGCSGKNKSPQLSWSTGPAATKSYAVMVYDPDAPTGSGWWHWSVVNIHPSVTSLQSGAGNRTIPRGAIETNTDFGRPGFGGACPPKHDKKHRYYFMVFALNVAKLDIKPYTPAAQVSFMVRSHTIAKGKLKGYFGR